MFLPPFIRRAEKKLTDFELMIHGSSLRPVLRSAHMPITAEEYLRTVQINLAGTLVMFFTLWAFFLISGFELDIFGLQTSGTLLWILLFMLIVPGQYVMQSVLPADRCTGSEEPD